MKNKLLLAWLLLSSVFLCGQGLRYDSVANSTTTIAGSLVTTPLPGATVTVCSIPQIVASTGGASESGNVVTITTTAPHGLLAGQSVIIQDVGVAGYNGTFTIATAPGGAGSTTFTYVNGTTGLGNSGGGFAVPNSKPCTNTATIYSDPGLLTSLANPITADTQGNFGLWGNPGTYAYTISGNGIASAGPFYISLAIGVTGSNTFPSINNQCVIDGVIHPATAAGVNVCDAVLGTGTGEILVPSNVTSLIGTNIVLSKHHYLVVQGNGPITVSPIRVPDSLTDSSADSGIRCPDHAKLLLAANSNTGFIEDTNFATLSGSGNTHGTFRFTMLGCRIDGNKNNQAALVTTGTGSISTVARSAGGVTTLVFSNTPNPAFTAGMTVEVGGLGPLVNAVTNDGYSFNGRYIVQSATSNSITYNNNLCLLNTSCHVIATTAATGTTPIAVGYSGSTGVRIYGLAPDFRDNVIANNVFDGQWSEGNDATFVDDTTLGTGNFIANHHVNSGGDGFVFWGPQVSHFVDNEIYGHGQWGREVFNGLEDHSTTSFNNGSGSLRVGYAGAMQENSSQETSGSGWGILVENGAAAYQTFSGMVNSAGTGIALETRSGNVNFCCVLTNSATGWKNNSTSAGNKIFATITSTTSSAIDTTTSGGGNEVHAFVSMSAGTVLTGSFPASDDVSIYATGTVNSTLRQIAGVPGTTGSITFPAPGSLPQNVCYNQLDCSYNVVQTFVGSPVSINAGTVAQFKRFKVVNGTTLTTGNFGSLGAGWGASATISAATGQDQAGTVTIASAGAGQAANPSVVLTFANGTWTNTPTCTGGRVDTNAPLGQPVLAPSATTIVFTFAGTPVVGTSYTMSWTCIGN